MNFLKKVDKFSSNICFIDEKEKKTLYKNVLLQTDILSRNLKSRSLILVLAQNHKDFLVSYVSFFRKGLVQMLIDSKVSNNILKELIEAYAPNYILLPKSRTKDLKNYQILNKLDKHIILKLNNDNFYSINKDLALLLSTSGSTGSKKFVRISYENIYQNTKSIINFLKINENHKTITTMPPFYTYGLSVINTHLFVGASILLTNIKVIEKSFWKLTKDQKITSFAGVPYFFEILKKIKFNKFNLPDLKYFTQAGGALRKDLIEYFLNYAEKNKKKFIIMYGQTEATARMTYLPYKTFRKKIGSVGKPIKGGRIRLVNESSRDGKKGEIIYEGKNVSMGYANNCNDLNKTDENKGILRTGDLAIKDQDGFFYIIGRKSRDIKLFGHRINLDEIEQILFEKGYNCSCCGSDNEVTIFHVDSTYNSEILEYISKTINIHPDCFKLKHIKKFPLNENGKVSYKKLETFL
jgi:acyl-CoA synthetase (AMP-forming)/AMP-acid ligase II